jgi:hypothetical protein
MSPNTKGRLVGLGICLISWPVPLLFLVSPYPKLATPAWFITCGLFTIVYLQRARMIAWVRSLDHLRKKSDGVG